MTLCICIQITRRTVALPAAHGLASTPEMRLLWSGQPSPRKHAAVLGSYERGPSRNWHDLAGLALASRILTREPQSQARDRQTGKHTFSFHYVLCLLRCILGLNIIIWLIISLSRSWKLFKSTHFHYSHTTLNYRILTKLLDYSFPN